MPNARDIVRLDRVDVEIDGRQILGAIDLRLGVGSRLGVVGGNGSGKSTLLALLAGNRWPAPGRGSRTYDFGDGPERDAVTARQRVALVGHELQDLYFARGWNFRVRDVVLSGFTRSDVPRRRGSRALAGRAAELIGRVGLGALAGRRFLGLSRGEQRLVLIARALALGPDLLLLDEPASGLDAAARMALDRLLQRIAPTTTIVVAAHEADALPAVVTEVARLEAGRLSEPAERSMKESTRPAGGPAEAGDEPAAGTAAAMPGEALIVLEQVDVWLDGRRVLADIDWTLRDGERWLITGPNGAGKSSLLRLLHGELRPARGGSIRWPGLGNPANVWTLRQQVGLVSPELQARYLYPATVLEVVVSGFHASIGAVRRPTAEQAERAAALLDAFELEDSAGRPLRSLSWGQRQRTLIARALATAPRVLLLDEPWAGLDPASARLVRRAIGSSIAAGTAIVCVSHVGAGGLPLTRRLRLEAGWIVSGDGSAAPRGSSASARRRATGSRQR